MLLKILEKGEALKSFGLRSIFSFYLGFLSQTFIIPRTAGEGGGYFFNFSLPLPPASWTLRHELGDYY